MGVASAKIMFVAILSFEVVLQCEITNIVIVTKKLTNKHKEKFVILQSIGIIVIKSKQTRVVRLQIF